MINCFHFQNICEHHGVDLWSEEYWALYRKYAGAQAYLRCTYVMPPPPCRCTTHPAS